MSAKILIAGGTCSGKSTLARCIASHTGYPAASFGECLRNYARETNLPLTVETLQNLGQGLIAQLGYDGFLHWVISHSPTIQWDRALILDGVRHTAMYESIKKTFPGNVLVYCACDRVTQMARLLNRDKASKEDAERILSHSLEQFVSSLEQQANLIFRPEDSMDDFLAKLDALIAKLP